MQHTLGMLNFENDCSQQYVVTKHAHYLLGVDDKVGESSRWKHVVLIEIEDVARKKIRFKIF